MNKIVLYDLLITMVILDTNKRTKVQAVYLKGKWFYGKQIWIWSFTSSGYDLALIYMLLKRIRSCRVKVFMLNETALTFKQEGHFGST